jgi:hypothetical protein
MSNEWEMFFATTECYLNLIYAVFTFIIGTTIQLCAYFKFRDKIVPIYVPELVGVVSSIPLTIFIFSMKHFIFGECIN